MTLSLTLAVAVACLTSCITCYSSFVLTNASDPGIASDISGLNEAVTINQIQTNKFNIEGLCVKCFFTPDGCTCEQKFCDNEPLINVERFLCDVVKHAANFNDLKCQNYKENDGFRLWRKGKFPRLAPQTGEFDLPDQNGKKWVDLVLALPLS